MTAVADGAALARLAAAKGHFFGRRGGVFHRRDSGAGVAAVTKRLRGGSPTGAPLIFFAFLDGGKIGKRLRRYGISHFSTPIVNLQTILGFVKCFCMFWIIFFRFRFMFCD